MKRFTCTLQYTITVTAHVDVDADSADEAERAALDEADDDLEWCDTGETEPTVVQIEEVSP